VSKITGGERDNHKCHDGCNKHILGHGNGLTAQLMMTVHTTLLGDLPICLSKPIPPFLPVGRAIRQAGVGCKLSGLVCGSNLSSGNGEMKRPVRFPKPDRSGKQLEKKVTFVNVSLITCIETGGAKTWFFL